MLIIFRSNQNALVIGSAPVPRLLIVVVVVGAAAMDLLVGMMTTTIVVGLLVGTVPGATVSALLHRAVMTTTREAVTIAPRRRPVVVALRWMTTRHPDDLAMRMTFATLTLHLAAAGMVLLLLAATLMTPTLTDTGVVAHQATIDPDHHVEPAAHLGLAAATRGVMTVKATGD